MVLSRTLVDVTYVFSSSVALMDTGVEGVYFQLVSYQGFEGHPPPKEIPKDPRVVAPTQILKLFQDNFCERRQLLTFHRYS